MQVGRGTGQYRPQPFADRRLGTGIQLGVLVGQQHPILNADHARLGQHVHRPDLRLNLGVADQTGQSLQTPRVWMIRASA